MKRKEKKIKILVLGADGFLGSNLVKSLHEDKEYKIYAFDLFNGGISKNINFFDKNLIKVAGNFLKKEDLKKALVGIDYVFHFISSSYPSSSMNDPLSDIRFNIEGTINLLEECVKAKVKKIIFASSGGAVYGNQNKIFYKEDDNTEPISPYAISKLTIEKYLNYYKIHRGLEYIILRYSNPYGPGQNFKGGQGIIPIFINLIKQEKPITIFGDGKNIRDYIYIDDLINITKLIFKKKNQYSVYNVGSGEGKSINEIVDLLRESFSNNVLIHKRKNRSVDIKRVVLNIDRISKEINYRPQTSIKEGIKKTQDWINSLKE